jgi:hypothetical protein
MEKTRKGKDATMATVKIEGIVGDPLGTKGFTLVENVKLWDGRQFDTYWKVWTDKTPAQGSFVEVTGELTALLDTYDPNKPKVAKSVNDATVKVLRAAETDSSPF